MKKDELKLEYLPDYFIEQEVHLLDAILSQVPYSSNKTVETTFDKKVFGKTKDVWHKRILAVLDRFEKVGVVKNFNLERFILNQTIIVDFIEDPFNEYRNILLEEQSRRNIAKVTKIFAWIKNNSFYIRTSQEDEPLSLTFKEDGKKYITFSFLKVLYGYWENKYYKDQLDKKYRCNIPRTYLIDEMIKEGFNEFAIRLNDTKTNLEKKLNTSPRLANQVTISFDDDTSIIFGIRPYHV